MATEFADVPDGTGAPAPDMRAHALRYCAAGLSVFPVCSPAMGQHTHHGEACESPGKVPLVAWARCQTEVTDLAQVDQWWNRWPDANIGFATGRVSGVVVLDADGEDARRSVLQLGSISQTPAIWTGRPGGIHFWFAYPGDGAPSPRNFAGRIPGVDFRGDGGYALLPPSLHKTGTRYRWAGDGGSTEHLTPVPMPEWLVELLRGSGAPVVSAGADGATIGDSPPLDLEMITRGIPEGQRNDTLYRYAGWLRGQDVPYEAARALMANAARACSPPFETDIALDMIRRAYESYRPNERLGGGGSGSSALGSDDDSQAADDPRPYRPPGVVPPFPLDVLPGSVQRYVCTQAAQCSSPVDGLALTLLVAAGNALGNSVRASMGPGWVEWGILYGVLVAPPGSRKSTVVTRGLRPYREGISKPIERAWLKRSEAYKRQLADYKKLSPKERVGHEPPDEPEPEERVELSDFTNEVLRKALPTAKHTLMHRDEIAGYFESFNQYRSGAGADRQNFLQFWNANEYGVRIDRVGAGSFTVTAPCFSMIGTIQPEALAVLRGLQGNDGAIDRLCLVYPDPQRVVLNLESTSETGGLDEMADIFAQLHRLDGTPDLAGNIEPAVMEFTPDAKLAYTAWGQPRLDGILSGEIPAHLRNRVSKDGTYLVRFALILHTLHTLATGAQLTNWIGVESVLGAIRLVEYFEAHADRIYQVIVDERTKDERTHVLDTSRVEKLTRALRDSDGGLTQKAIYKTVFGHHVKAKEIRAMLADMEERGVVKSSQKTNGAPTPATLWTIRNGTI